MTTACLEWITCAARHYLLERGTSTATLYIRELPVAYAYGLHHGTGTIQGSLRTHSTESNRNEGVGSALPNHGLN